jgi:hypothetical protein
VPGLRNQDLQDREALLGVAALGRRLIRPRIAISGTG